VTSSVRLDCKFSRRGPQHTRAEGPNTLGKITRCPATHQPKSPRTGSHQTKFLAGLYPPGIIPAASHPPGEVLVARHANFVHG
ncbi:MAG TPA: hypothetical protein VIV12_17215, partial [Streptosporangiaceae bacterium]